ncbi:hypothetical protein [Tepidibacillus marianensis]|uniref:hypothetical protein n=1 Tax=Tepidibacillus marianensis TaxID=3131995 RepID=UPI0030D156BD
MTNDSQFNLGIYYLYMNIYPADVNDKKRGEKMILDQVMNAMEKFMVALNEAEPDKRDHFMKTTATLFQITTEALKVSPEVRDGFLKVHAEFLQYPEAEDMIKESIKAYQKYLK